MSEEKINEKEILIPEKPDYVEELLSIIKSGKSNAEIRELLNDYHDNDIAEVIPELDESERKKLYRILGVDAVSNVFAYLDNVEDYLAELDNEKAADIIEEMDADDAIDVLNEEITEEDIFDIGEEIVGLVSFRFDTENAQYPLSFYRYILSSHLLPKDLKYRHALLLVF